MSFTQKQTLFAGLHENGLNDVLEAIFKTRGHHLHWGTTGYVPTSTAMATSLPEVKIIFPPLVIQYDIQFDIPTVDIVPAAPAALNALPGEFLIKTRVTLQSTINNFPLVSGSVGVVGLCEPIVISSPPGSESIGISLKQVEIVDLPPTFENIAEMVILPILKLAMAGVTIPFQTMTVGAFTFQLLEGPIPELNLMKVRGQVV